MEEHRGYATPAGFGGFVLNTVDKRFTWFGLQNLRVEFRGHVASSKSSC
jgi:hypothetical protein